MTTEPPRPPGPSGLAGISVRTRLAVAVALLTGLALASAGLLVFTLESARLDSAVLAHIEQEVAEFQQLLDGQGTDTAQPFTGVEELIDLYLRRNVPAEDEVLVGYWDGAARLSSPGSPHPGLTRLPEFLGVVEQRLRTGGSQHIDTPYGEVIVTVAPVRSPSTEGALVIANFLQDERAEVRQVMRTYAMVSLTMLGLITAAAAWQAGRLLSPLRTLRETVQEITETDLSQRIPETGKDDITALTRTFNQMLSRLDRAFTSQRQFLDDAGHELRTPLTVLRGHLELVDAQNPSEVAATRDLLLDEVDRMSRLVEDLILLAKTARPDFFRMAPVQVAPYLETVLEKCRALGPRVWRIEETADAEASFDAQRITQALLQLAQNAVKHTRDGDEIALGARFAPGRGLRLWVRDSGDGVPDDDKERIFERFGRGDVTPDDDGLGLGLSIVEAIVRTHGGTVRAEDAPGSGARFTLSLPTEAKETMWQEF